jgi:hypothetical protein
MQAHSLSTARATSLVYTADAALKARLWELRCLVHSPQYTRA